MSAEIHCKGCGEPFCACKDPLTIRVVSLKGDGWHKKCSRCSRHTKDVGMNLYWQDICLRCADVLKMMPGAEFEHVDLIDRPKDPPKVDYGPGPFIEHGHRCCYVRCTDFRPLDEQPKCIKCRLTLCIDCLRERVEIEGKLYHKDCYSPDKEETWESCSCHKEG